MIIFLKRALRPLLIIFLFIPVLLLSAQIGLILKNDSIMPEKEVKKILEMGRELYEKTKIPVFIAAVDKLDENRPIDLLQRIKRDHKTYILLYFSINPTAVNIFASDDAKKLIDIDQILSPLPWSGTIKPVMSPAFSKNSSEKYEVALLNGYADIVDQVADSKSVVLNSSIGSGSRRSFQIVRLIFYAILGFILLKFIFMRKKSRDEQ